MRNGGKALVLTGAALIMGVMLLIALPSPAKVAKPEFVPGSRVVIKVGKSTIEGTVVKRNSSWVMQDRWHGETAKAPEPAQDKTPMYRGPYLFWTSRLI